MSKVIHRADTRGLADHGWLKSHHTFSFAGYHNPERMNFGLLRVLNDDVVEAGRGFDTHPHENMEIVSIPLKGSLRHKDSMGNEHIIQQGEVQIMSAGTGVTHSEYNNSDTEKVNFLQIWVIPKENNIKPHYGQKMFAPEKRTNQFQIIVAPNEREGSLWINQGAYFSLGSFDKAKKAFYTLKQPTNGLYVFVIDGSISIAEENLNKRDAMGITDVETVNLHFVEPTEVLLIEVPM